MYFVPFVVKVLNEPMFMHSSLDNAAIARPAAELQEASVQIRKRLGKDFELDLALALPPGITILFGPSGAGKTTLLDCIAGLVRPDAGRIATQEKVLFDNALGINAAPRFRRIGYVFQDLALFPHLTVEGNVEYGLSALSGEQRKQRSAAILESFRIAHLRGRRPGRFPAGSGSGSHWPAPW